MSKQTEKQFIHGAHEFAPVFDHNSKVLILGTFPSVKSRATNFYYGHPQNRFWKVIARLAKCEEPKSIPEKKAMLLEHGIAVWDVIAQCDIVGSSDSSIKNVVPADLSRILSGGNIQKIYANGAMAKKLYEKYSYADTGIEIIGLPSTSPANAAYSVDRLMESWGQIEELLSGRHCNF